jgi:RNA polymerase sigma factor (sigma-70 family)
MKTAAIINPFRPDQQCEATDIRLAVDASAGSQQALETLVARHQRWIYNLAFRMVMVREEAEDITQEVLIKVITKLAGYDPDKAAFRTWLYRIVTNHVINMKTRGFEAAVTDLETYYSFAEKIPDQNPETSPETELMIADLATSCVMGTLLCLERKQRVAFILAVGFGCTDVIGAEVLDMRRDAFRQTLSRARARLNRYMSGHCSLLNPEAPCHCSKKIAGLAAVGACSPDRILFHHPDSPRLSDLIDSTMEKFDEEIHDDLARLHRRQPYYESPNAVSWLRDMLADHGFPENTRLDDNEENPS